MVTVLCMQRCSGAKHNLSYRTVELSLPDMHAAKVWMIDNQLGRRNITKGQMKLLIGLRYEVEKQQGARADLTCDQIEHKSERTAEKLAEQYQVSPMTIRRNANYATDINAIAAATDHQGAAIVMSTEGKLGRKEVKALAELAQSNPEATTKVPHSLVSDHARRSGCVALIHVISGRPYRL